MTENNMTTEKLGTANKSESLRIDKLTETAQRLMAINGVLDNVSGRALWSWRGL